EHELHALEKDARRIPVVVGLQLCESLLVVVIPHRFRPTGAQSWLRSLGQRREEPFHQRQTARLAPGVAADVPDRAVRSTTEKRFAQPLAGVVLSLLIRGRWRRRGLEDFAVVAALVLLAVDVHI